MVLEQNRTEHMCLSRALLYRHNRLLDDRYAVMPLTSLADDECLCLVYGDWIVWKALWNDGYE